MKSLLRPLLFALALGGMAVQVSCMGYSFGASKPQKLEHVKNIFIPTPANKTLLPRAEVLLGNAVSEQMSVDNTYRVVGKSRSDASLEITIDNINYSGWLNDRRNINRTLETQLVLTVSYRLLDSSGKLLDSGSLETNSSYFNDEFSDQQAARWNAYSFAARRAAVMVVQRIAIGF